MAAALMLAVIVGVALVRGRTRPEEPQVWTWFLCGALTLCISVLAGSLSVLGAHPSARSEAFSGTVFAAGCLLAAPAFYQGLLRWSRIRTGHSNSADWLNAASAVLVAMAAVNVFRPVPAGLTPGIEIWQRQMSMGVFACSVVLLGTVLSVNAYAALGRDIRIWLLGAATIMLGAVPVISNLNHPVGLRAAQGLALMTVVLLVVASRSGAHPELETRLLPATQVTTVGTLVVLLCGVAVLPAAGPLGTVYAILAIIGCSARFMQVIRELALLAQSRHEARTDDLTGIPNRRALLRALDEALDSGVATTLLLVDLDRFKIVNDRYGHAVGDELLRRVATAFAASVPQRSLLARLGGDEFAVLLTGDAVRHSLHVSWRLVQVAAPHLDPAGRPLHIGASIGVAETLDPTSDRIGAGELLRRADTAMYQAKTAQSGVSVYDGLVDARALAQHQLVEELVDVLAPGSPSGDQIRVYFQPQVDVATGEVVGAEALVRWQHTSRGLLGPEHFLDLVEENGLMPLLTARVVAQAAGQWNSWRLAGHRLRVSVNLSASALVHPSLSVALDGVLAAGVDPSRFVLEITETSLMVDPELALATMRGIASRGFGFSIDDYGTGYSSLSYLNDLPASELKIDRSFTMRILTDPRTAAIVAATVELAHRLGMRLVVEGVEDLETLEALHEMGCNEAQGFLHSRPLAAEAFQTWLERRTAGSPV